MNPVKGGTKDQCEGNQKRVIQTHAVLRHEQCLVAAPVRATGLSMTRADDTMHH